jgi:hypothetical protein
MTALQQKKNTLQSSAGILFTQFSETTNVASLPPEPANKKENAGHLFATRFPAAWNLSQLIVKDGVCIVPKVDLVIADFFRLRPAPGFNDEMPDFRFITSNYGEEEHGYLVSATAAARFDAGPTTGANPFSQCLNVKGIEIGGYSSIERTNVIAGNLPQAKFILNLSLGLGAYCHDSCFPELFGSEKIARNTLLQRLLDAIDWRRTMGPRDADFLAAVAASNKRDYQSASIYPLFGTAFLSNPLATSASTQVFGSPSLQLLQDTPLFTPDAEKYGEYPAIGLTELQIAQLNFYMKGTLGETPTPAPNVLTVGGVNLSGEIESDFSNKGPDVHSVAQEIIVLKENLEGTSFAAPQVAGLASYLWLLSPELRALPASVTREAILKNTHITGDVRLIDAYASVLSLDDVGPVTPASRPIRLALLDVDANGVFNAADVEQISVALLDTTGEPSDAQQHWDRYDLNGDGYTGGTRTSWFDLDRTTSTRFGAAVYNANTSQTIGEKNIVFDEIAVTDLDVLCYYAYSPLYTGDTTLRDARLLAPCANKYGTATSAPSVVSSVVSGDTVFAYSPLPTPTSAQGVWMVPYDLTLNQWGTAQLMAPIGPSYATQASIATSKKSLNDVLFVWQANATANILSVAHFDKARAKWLDTVTIPLSASAILDSISVAVSDNGDACVAWIQLANGNFNVFASVARHTTGVWTDPQQIGTVGPAGGSTLSAVAARNGVFHVAWSQVKLNPDIGGYDSFIAATHYDGTWHQAEPLLPFVSPSSGNHPQLGIHEESGDVYALWQSAGSTVIAAVRDATTGLWTGPGLQAFDCPPPTPAPGARPGCYPHLIVNDQGDAIATWVNQLITTTYASYYSRSTHSWSAPVVMATPNTSGETFPVMDDAGNGRVIWRGLKTPYVYVPGGPPPPPTFILSRRIVAGGGWGPIETIVEGNNPGFYAPPIMTPNGTTFITGYEGGGKYFSKRFK